MNLTKYGVFTARSIKPEDLPRAAALAEELGFGAFWLGGSPRLTALEPMLAATSKITLATGIVNVWTYEPQELAAEFTQLEERYPGRVLVGIGIGHREVTKEYTAPLGTMNAFYDGIAAAPSPIPQDRMVTAALGPRMLDLSLERSLGTHPYFTPPEHTRFARERLGADALVAPAVSVILDEDQRVAASKARDYAALYLQRVNYANNLKRFGFSEEDVDGAGSGRLRRIVVPQGSAAAITPRLQEHLDAGADHVAINCIGVHGVPEREWRAFAELLLG